MEELKRLFLALEVVAPWPKDFPEGRILEETDRHMTLVFLGDAHLPTIRQLVQAFPAPPFSMGLAGIFDHFVFLPPHSPRVVAYHVQWLEREQELLDYHSRLVAYLMQKGLSPKVKEKFLSHVTIAREPFVIHEWKQAFTPLPCFIRNIRLCESLGYSRYETCWEIPVLSPFEPMEHTADLAFIIRGVDWNQICLHAWLALCFHAPDLVSFFEPMRASSLEEAVQMLNRWIARVDGEVGSPFKAVSYHGKMEVGAMITWEMIVDV